jgi:thiol:disulfide interchange protein DsbD
MKTYHFLISITLTIFSFSNLFSQSISPVKWNFELKKLGKDNYELIGTATMDKTWVIYSQYTDENGAIPTEFLLNDQVIKMEEKGKAIKEFDPMFDVDVIKFKDKAEFRYVFSRKNAKTAKGSVSFMTCDGSKCLPPTDSYFDLNF